MSAAARSLGARGLVRLALAPVLALVLVACSGDDDTAAPQATRPAATTAATTTTTQPAATQLCAAPAPAQVGTIADPAIVELSGLAASRISPDVFWANNDSGDSARVFAIDRSGATRTIATVEGATAVDWEDIAVFESTIYVGDIGDNGRVRDGIVVYEFAEPALGAPTATVAATALSLSYPDGAHDAEALMIDPISRQFVIVTKEPAGTSGVYTGPLGTSGPLELVATLDLGIGQLVTAGDISVNGSVIGLRTYTKVLLWNREGDEAVADAFAREPCAAPSPSEAQGESLALAAGGGAYLTASEGAGVALFQVTAASAPSSTSTDDTPGTSSGG